MEDQFQQYHLSDDLKKVFDDLPFYVLLVDNNHIIHYANKAVGIYLNKDLEAIVGQYCPKAIHNCDGPYYGCPLEEAVEKGQGVEREVFEPLINIWLTSAIYPTQLISPNGNQLYFHIIYNITARKNAEEELKEKQTEIIKLNISLDQKIKARTRDIESLLKQKDEFLHLLAHDLKNPLNIPNCLLPILEQNIQDAQQKEMVHACLKSIRTMKKLIADVLELSVIDDPSMQLRYVEINLHELIDSIIDINSMNSYKNGCDVVNRIDPGITISASRFQIEELFTNLLSNAIKYIPVGKSGHIQFNAHADDTKVHVTITDNGKGLTPDQIAHVFDKFYKVDSERKDMESTGLGLSLCQSIIEKHGGHIWVVSQGIDKGCAFHVSIPVHPPNQSEGGKYDLDN